MPITDTQVLVYLHPESRRSWQVDSQRDVYYEIAVSEDHIYVSARQAD